MKSGIRKKLARGKRKNQYRLRDIELRRNDQVFADALGAQRIPDPPRPATSAAASWRTM